MVVTVVYVLPLEQGNDECLHVGGTTSDDIRGGERPLNVDDPEMHHYSYSTVLYQLSQIVIHQCTFKYGVRIEVIS